jgi:uncharacterized protein (DUF3820 family)
MKPEDLQLLVTLEMPFGKYKGRLIADLPGNYLAWFAREGFPKGEIGRLLASDSVASRLRESHNLPAGGTQQDFVQQIAAERRRNQVLVKRSGGLLE